MCSSEDGFRGAKNGNGQTGCSTGRRSAVTAALPAVFREFDTFDGALDDVCPVACQLRMDVRWVRGSLVRLRIRPSNGILRGGVDPSFVRWAQSLRRRDSLGADGREGSGGRWSAGLRERRWECSRGTAHRGRTIGEGEGRVVGVPVSARSGQARSFSRCSSLWDPALGAVRTTHPARGVGWLMRNEAGKCFASGGGESGWVRGNRCLDTAVGLAGSTRRRLRRGKERAGTSPRRECAKRSPPEKQRAPSEWSPVGGSGRSIRSRKNLTDWWEMEARSERKSSGCSQVGSGGRTAVALLGWRTWPEVGGCVGKR